MTELNQEIKKDFRKLLIEIEASIATLFIGSDHGITPQAMAAMRDTLNLVFELEDKHFKRKKSA